MPAVLCLWSLEHRASALETGQLFRILAPSQHDLGQLPDFHRPASSSQDSILITAPTTLMGFFDCKQETQTLLTSAERGSIGSTWSSWQNQREVQRSPSQTGQSPGPLDPVGRTCGQACQDVVKSGSCVRVVFQKLYLPGPFSHFPASWPEEKKALGLTSGGGRASVTRRRRRFVYMVPVRCLAPCLPHCKEPKNQQLCVNSFKLE